MTANPAPAADQPVTIHVTPLALTVIKACAADAGMTAEEWCCDQVKQTLAEVLGVRDREPGQ